MLLGHHRRVLEGGPLRSRRRWERPKTFDEARDSILAKIEAIEKVSRAEEAVRVEAEASAIGAMTDLLGC